MSPRDSHITIRPAKQGDEALVCTFIRELAEYERLLHECQATEENISAALFAPSPRVFCEIAESDGAAAGFALWFYNFSTFRAKHGIYLEDLFVRPEFRGRGIGKALLVHLAQRAMREGCGRFEWSVLNWNEPSIAFYKSLGAKPLSDWTTFRIDGDALASLAQR
ncbi:MAG TPA: GNAT family N-acetyltransferase [Rhizomicrobium sp.]